MGLNEATQLVIGCGIRVSNTLGVGFLEKIYENAMAIELARSGLSFEQQSPISVFYEGIEVGRYWPDLLVEGQVIVELKVAKAIDPAHEAQVLNYLRATNLLAGLILNFGTPRMGIRRMHHEPSPFISVHPCSKA